MKLETALAIALVLAVASWTQDFFPKEAHNLNWGKVRLKRATGIISAARGQNTASVEHSYAGYLSSPTTALAPRILKIPPQRT